MTQFPTRVALTAPATILVAVLAFATSAQASIETFYNDPEGDVAVDGGSLNETAYDAADLTTRSSIEPNRPTLRIGFSTNGAEPGTAATMLYQATVKVTQKKKKKIRIAGTNRFKKVRPKGYVVTATLGNDPINPIAVISNKGGSTRGIACDASSSIDLTNSTVFINIPYVCLGKKAESVTTSLLVTAVDTVTGARGRDGLSMSKLRL